MKKPVATATNQEADDQEPLACQLISEKSRVELKEIQAAERILRENWNTIPQEVIDKAVDDLPKRLKKCIEAGAAILRINS